MPPKIEPIYDENDESPKTYRAGILNETDNVEIWVVDGIPDPVQADELARAACAGFRHGWDTLVRHYEEHIKTMRMN